MVSVSRKSAFSSFACRFAGVLATASLFLAPWAAGAGVPGEDLVKAPPGFSHQGKQVISVDFQSEELDLVFDTTTLRGTGKARVVFFAKEAGSPMLDFVPGADGVRLNGKNLGFDALRLVTSPDGATQFKILDATVTAGSTNVLEVDYTFPSEHLTIDATGVRVGFFMSDVGADRDFLEQYAPANFEFDRFKLDVKMEVRGATGKHRIFTNGDVEELDGGAWRVRFPDYFVSSSIFLHLTNKEVFVSTGEYKGLVATIPVVAYAETENLAQVGLSRSLETLEELEGTYGPFAHKKLVVYVTSGGGGMEYCGATMTSLSALGHELTHSWFARGVMPASGNSGWMDEAIASWRDNGYPTAWGAPNRPPVNLGAFSPYRRTTPNAAYTSGAQLISEFDFIFKGTSGFRTILRGLFGEHKHETITTPEFHDFVERVTGTDLDKIFQRYVYGKAESNRELFLPGIIGMEMTPMISLHPRRFTREELIRYR